MNLLYHPAGADDALRAAMTELAVGRWMSMRGLLVETGSNWPLRSFRTRVLGIMAAGSDVVEAWLAEEPDSYDAQVMQARVSVERALRARRQQHASAGRLEQRARVLAASVSQHDWRDPVPWLCLLTLAQLDAGQVWREHRVRAAEPMLPAGPWGLLCEVHRRDPFSREAYHRMVQFLLARRVAEAGALAEVMDFSRWAASWAAEGSPLLLLPLYSLAEQFRRRGGRWRPATWRLQWAEEPTIGYTLRAYEGWFRKADSGLRSVSDLNHLACALWAGHKLVQAAEVFDAMGPYAAWEPWASVQDYGDQQDAAKALFLRARSESYTARSHARHRGPVAGQQTRPSA
ncbi:hypothetical protein O1L44_32030 [Streptomyces noursei]|uniref:hypothetical protein n=1 Tax=Streptomyces noursei TaxID=1971 RepID=UPI00081CD20F|nr:hypothetical protein SNOUR_34830 [Streptomyces noursei ATCC 11455]MCZ0996698.1 hypothetical protein [Streptomyces noursei]